MIKERVMDELKDDLQKLQANRENVYGPWRDNMEGTSLQMQGLWQNYIASRGYIPRLLHKIGVWKIPLPPWWCPVMMVAVKLNRIASGNYVKDNFDDLRVYLSFIEEMQKETKDE